MNITSADFVVSNTKHTACPKPDKPEFAFIGRSNVGKSSLINMLVNRRKLAKISSTPGKTQTINHFIINQSWFLVDLPGYGYASVSRSTSRTWGPMIENYLDKRPNLVTTFILIDPRVEPQRIDLEFINWMGNRQLPFSLVFTKADKLSRNQLKQSLALWQKKLSESWEELPPLFATSTKTHDGRDTLLGYIESLLTKE